MPAQHIISPLFNQKKHCGKTRRRTISFTREWSSFTATLSPSRLMVSRQPSAMLNAPHLPAHTPAECPTNVLHHGSRAGRDACRTPVVDTAGGAVTAGSGAGLWLLASFCGGDLRPRFLCLCSGFLFPPAFARVDSRLSQPCARSAESICDPGIPTPGNTTAHAQITRPDCTPTHDTAFVGVNFPFTR